MMRLPIGLLKKKLADLEAQAGELTRMMLGRGELAAAMALRTIDDEDLDLLEAWARRLEADPEALPLPREQAAAEQFQELEGKYAACRTAEEAAAVYRAARPGVLSLEIVDLSRQLDAAAAAIPGNGHGPQARSEGNAR